MLCRGRQPPSLVSAGTPRPPEARGSLAVDGGEAPAVPCVGAAAWGLEWGSPGARIRLSGLCPEAEVGTGLREAGGGLITSWSCGADRHGDTAGFLDGCWRRGSHPHHRSTRPTPGEQAGFPGWSPWIRRSPAGCGPGFWPLALCTFSLSCRSRKLKPEAHAVPNLADVF